MTTPYDTVHQGWCPKEICDVDCNCARIGQKRGCARNPIVLVPGLPAVGPPKFKKEVDLGGKGEDSNQGEIRWKVLETNSKKE